MTARLSHNPHTPPDGVTKPRASVRRAVPPTSDPRFWAAWSVLTAVFVVGHQLAQHL